MREPMGAIIERDKQARVPVFGSLRRVVFYVADGPVDGGPADFCDVRLVDGRSACGSGKRARLAVETMVLQPQAELLLPSLRAEFPGVDHRRPVQDGNAEKRKENLDILCRL